MKKVAFNQNGFDVKKRELVSLPQSELSQQLFELVHNPEVWVKRNFILSSEQLVKLSEMPHTFLRQLSLNTTEFCYN